MKFNLLLSVSAAILALSACGPKAGDPAATENTSLNQTLPEAAAPALSAGQTFANTAAASDAFEIESSRLALSNSQSAAIKSFAQKMIDAHTASTDKLKAAAAAASPVITPVPSLTADQQGKLDTLRSASGAAFDQAYVDAQTAGHQMTLDALKSYAANGDVPSLKSFAGELVPIVTAHLNMAKGLKP